MSEGMSGQAANALQVLLARRILGHIRERRLPVGQHLPEQSLEALLGTSRTPIRRALGLLAERGILEQRPHRGFFLARPAGELEPASQAMPECRNEQLHLAIARDRLAGTLPDVLTETEAMRRYDVPRDRLRAVLARIAREGWIERRPGKGWAFRPMIDTPGADAEARAFRRTLEPAGLLMPTFAIDSAVLDRLRARQQAVVDGGCRSATAVELFGADAEFHEGLAGLSGNRFVLHALVRVNHLRRLVAYERAGSRDPDWLLRRFGEHLAILALLQRGKRRAAAELLAGHLEGNEAG